MRDEFLSKAFSKLQHAIAALWREHSADAFVPLHVI